jgi:hypothetical protein
VSEQCAARFFDDRPWTPTVFRVMVIEKIHRALRPLARRSIAFRQIPHHFRIRKNARSVIVQIGLDEFAEKEACSFQSL